jgi:hypothetical protein
LQCSEVFESGAVSRSETATRISHMSLTITGVAGAGATDFAAPAAPTELPVADFVAMLQNSPMSGMPQLANPAALASELFGHLRGFVERAHYYENMKLSRVPTADGGNAVLVSADGDQLANLSGGGAAQNNPTLADLARVDARPDEREGSTLQSAGITLADLQRLQEFCLATLNFSTEAALAGSGVSQGVRSINTLLRAQ